MSTQVKFYWIINAIAGFVLFMLMIYYGIVLDYKSVYVEDRFKIEEQSMIVSILFFITLVIGFIRFFKTRN